MPAAAQNAPATNIILSYSPGDVNVHCIQHGLPTWVCSSKTASRSVYPFLQGSWLCPTPKYPTLYNVYKWIRHPSKYALPPWRDMDPIYVVPWAHIPHEPTSQTDSLAVWPFLQGSQWCPTHRHLHRQTTPLLLWPHLCYACLRTINDTYCEHALHSKRGVLQHFVQLTSCSCVLFQWLLRCIERLLQLFVLASEHRHLISVTHQSLTASTHLTVGSARFMLVTHCCFGSVTHVQLYNASSCLVAISFVWS